MPWVPGVPCAGERGSTSQPGMVSERQEKEGYMYNSPLLLLFLGGVGGLGIKPGVLLVVEAVELQVRYRPAVCTCMRER